MPTLVSKCTDSLILLPAHTDVSNGMVVVLTTDAGSELDPAR